MRGRRWAGPLLLAVAAVAVLVLRSELMTRHVPPPPGAWTDVVVEARVRHAASPTQEMARSLVDTCRLTVDTRTRTTALREVAPSVFAFRLTPALDEYDRRELRGCLQDLREERVLLDVRELRTVVPTG